MKNLIITVRVANIGKTKVSFKALVASLRTAWKQHLLTCNTVLPSNI
jgi:hypothetical protein